MQENTLKNRINSVSKNIYGKRVVSYFKQIVFIVFDCGMFLNFFKIRRRCSVNIVVVNVQEQDHVRVLSINL